MLSFVELSQMVKYSTQVIGMKLNIALKRGFKSALKRYHQSLWKRPPSRELDFINRTVASFKSLKISAGGQSLKARSKRIHLKPMVEYYPYGLLLPNVHTTVEMGDLLFIYKHFLNGFLGAYRAVIVQAKYTKGKKRSWRIDTDQFYFLNHWPHFRIVKLVSKKWCPVSKKLYSIKPRTLTWATYGFVGPNATKYPVYYSSRRMLRYKTAIPSTKSFSFPVKSGIGWDSSTSFLLKFVQGFVGENLLLSTKVKVFVDDLYVFANWKPDPPGDPEWDNEKDEEGFGIVEFTAFTEEK